MPGIFWTEEKTIQITYTTDGKIVNRVVGSSGEGGSQEIEAKQVMVAYLEQFCGLKIQPIKKSALLLDIEQAVNKHLGYNRDEN